MQAYRQQVFYPQYLFIFIGWYSDQWWIGSNNDNLPCTPEQRERVIFSALAPIQEEYISNCSKTVDTGIVSYDMIEYSLGFLI